MNTVLKRPRKFRIAQNCKISQTVQLTLASLQTPFSMSELAYIVIAENSGGREWSKFQQKQG